jgi:hypothetical protein
MPTVFRDAILKGHVAFVTGGGTGITGGVARVDGGSVRVVARRTLIFPQAGGRGFDPPSLAPDFAIDYCFELRPRTAAIELIRLSGSMGLARCI